MTKVDYLKKGINIDLKWSEYLMNCKDNANLA
jgi:hypothetical protein